MLLPIRALRLSALLLLFALLPACGADRDVRAPGGSRSGALRLAEEHYLDLKIDGIRHEARGKPFGPEVSFGGQEVNVRIGGPSVSAVQAGMSTALGDHDIVLNLLVNGIEACSYGLTSSRNKVHRSETPLGFSELFFPKTEPYSKLASSSGLVTIEAVDGTGEGAGFRLNGVRGRLKGVFRDVAGGEYDVDMGFQYVR